MSSTLNFMRRGRELYLMMIPNHLSGQAKPAESTSMFGRKSDPNVLSLLSKFAATVALHF